ncbi:MAG: hypothetical protein ACWGNV_11180 [Bacteroidales bacterium]
MVVGIVIALQLDAWNAAGKDRQSEKQYLEEFRQDFLGDSARLAYFSDAYPKKIESLLQARSNVWHTTEIEDTLNFIDQISYGAVASRTSIFETRSTYNDIVSTGNLKLITNKSLRQQIISYYQFGENSQTYLDNLRTEYATFVNSYKPYDAHGTFTAEQGDIELYLQAVRTQEFLRLANSELTFAYAFGSRINRLSELNREILNELEDEIDRRR